MRNLLIYGGTFDPIHNGHINAAINIQNYFNFQQFIFLPCKIPLLKNKAIATATQRVEMLQLALKDLNKNFIIDLSEINRATPSYMVDTLGNFRQKAGENTAITLLMGEDTFRKIPQWHEWKRLLTLANFLVINRAGSDNSQPPDFLNKFFNAHKTNDNKAILNNAHGFIYRYDAGNFDISSTLIRNQLTEKEYLKDIVPSSVLSYIKQNHLYTQDTSKY
ncbi:MULTISPECIES: nicotinate-nucleotide adenylyltransferase [unclassified Legionella]|uniref:nicotinate-nucleotide adenylyltransferase n=1 Tax=unclassified Legionella TaxID=2622702 RepID=UPI0013EF7680|nr:MULTISPECIES: nicotinate-nucleotide adenylyltransferase [unclassified Legionella]MDI9818855.1 nicotinate-nucleotide adenylyltransferase [Legionella sp. PL877]